MKSTPTAATTHKGVAKNAETPIVCVLFSQELCALPAYPMITGDVHHHDVSGELASVVKLRQPRQAG